MRIVLRLNCSCVGLDLASSIVMRWFCAFVLFVSTCVHAFNFDDSDLASTVVSPARVGMATLFPDSEQRPRVVVVSEPTIVESSGNNDEVWAETIKTSTRLPKKIKNDKATKTKSKTKSKPQLKANAKAKSKITTVARTKKISKNKKVSQYRRKATARRKLASTELPPKRIVK